MKIIGDMLHNRCPRCRQFSMWRGLFKMHTTCGVCGLRFEREQGYFIGAIYVSYTLTMIVGFPVWFSLVFFFDQSWTVAVGAVALLVVIFYPFIFRYARVGWLYLDHRFDPLEEPKGA